MRRAALLFIAVLPLGAEEPLHEMGPFPTREMFPLYLPTLAYQPVDPVPLGRGHWRWALNWIEANTFQFSDVFENNPPRDTSGRVAITRPYMEAHLPEYASLPVVYFFDEEIARFELESRDGTRAMGSRPSGGPPPAMSSTSVAPSSSAPTAAPTTPPSASGTGWGSMPPGNTGDGGGPSPSCNSTGRAATCTRSPTSISTSRASSTIWASTGTGRPIPRSPSTT